MAENVFNKEKLINYWMEASDDDYNTMMVMYKTKRFNWALFIGHLMIEKLLKAYFVKAKSDYPPYIHNLLRLAEKGNLDIPNDIKEQLILITAFNINARYDDYKRSFKQKCTPEFTEDWIGKMQNLRKWIKKQIMQ